MLVLHSEQAHAMAVASVRCEKSTSEFAVVCLVLTCLVSSSSAGADRFSEGPMCRNCHVYVDNAHVATLPPKGEEEIALTEWIKNKNAKSVEQQTVGAIT